MSSTQTVNPVRLFQESDNNGNPDVGTVDARYPVRLYGVMTLLVFVVTSIPYAAGYLVQNDQIRFTGVVFDVVDTAQYFAWMRSFSDSVLIANPLTPEPGELRFFNLQWWLLGLLAFKTPLGAVITYQILRIVAVAAFAVSIAWFCRLVAPRVERLAFTLIMASSGLGWIWVLEKQWTGELRHPLDVQMAEANTFFSAMAFPHLLIAAAAMVAIFCIALRLHQRWLWRDAVLLVPLTLALGFSHGYDLIPTMVVPSATVLVLMIARRAIPRLAFATSIIVAAAALPALYALGLTHLDATWNGVLAQYGNAGVFTPPPHRLVVLMGMPFLLALAQLRPGAWPGRSDFELFVRVWFVAGFLLAYIPTDYQIKMLIAYQVPVSILAAFTVQEISNALRGVRLARLRPAMFVPAAVILLVLMTNVYLTVWRVIDINRLEYPYFLSTGDVEALSELEHLVEPGDVVLSSPELGVFVPIYSDGRPYVAHWAQTLSFFERRDTAAAFFTLDTSDEFRQTVIRDNDIRFILYGPAEAGSRDPRPVAEVDFNLLTVMDGTTSIFEPGSVAGSRE